MFCDAENSELTRCLTWTPGAPAGLQFKEDEFNRRLKERVEEEEEKEQLMRNINGARDTILTPVVDTSSTKDSHVIHDVCDDVPGWPFLRLPVALSSFPLFLPAPPLPFLLSLHMITVAHENPEQTGTGASSGELHTGYAKTVKGGTRGMRRGWKCWGMMRE
ncbi:hypothetical protein E2C01_028842 [Portunus trituberculatus]|uniref:Uncharacterized protein n=1 Tax=Portunus trituberculatus TaxID=210409 RepID=A0A5B7ELI9_PORTR|nr:hypothetical protein [Portunus trituberculatus]